MGVADAFSEVKKHTQFRSIGLFKLMDFSGVQPDKETAAKWATAAKIDNAKFMKDLQTFRANLRKMQEGLTMMKEWNERETKRIQERKFQQAGLQKEEEKPE